MKHTPGPWESIGPEGYPIMVMAGNMRVCDIRGWGFLTGVGGLRLPDEQALQVQAANARLIVAAPDLLAACKFALQSFESRNATNMDVLRRAIAKAEAA